MPMPSPKIDAPAVIHSYTVVIFSRPRRRQPRCGCVACRGLLMVSEVPVNDSGEATSTYVPDFTYLRYLYHTHTIHSSYLIVTEVIALCAPRPTYPVPTIGNTEIFSSPSGHGRLQHRRPICQPQLFARSASLVAWCSCCEPDADESTKGTLLHLCTAKKLRLVQC